MEFVFDRTRENVLNAKKIKQDKFLKGVPLTDEEIQIMSKGALGLNDINRIQNNFNTIQGKMNRFGYFSQTSGGFGQFSQNGIFYDTYFKEWFTRIQALKKAFFPYSDTPSQPTARLYYEEINKLEKTLFDLNKRLVEMEGFFEECGNLECGGQI